jgi:hypothetical protein
MRIKNILGGAFSVFVALAGMPSSMAAAEGQPSPVKVDRVIVVFKTHFDIGYTDMASNIVQRYRTTMIDQALEVVDRNKNLPQDQQFAWTLPGWPLTKISEDWPGQTPERKRRVEAAILDGRFVTHALPFSTHTESLELEDLVRGLGYASRLSRTASIALPRDAKMTDVPCHSWILPALLKHAGVDFLHLGCNAASSSPVVPRLFWWEGPDGSRLLTMYTAESYGTGLVPPKDWPYRTWLALIHTGDNHGPPTPEETAKLREDARQLLPGVPVRIGRLSDFADAILAEKGSIPVVRGDMPDTWIHGPMSDPVGARLARNIRPAIVTTEVLNTHLTAWGMPATNIDAPMNLARERSLLYGEHTWGGAFSWVVNYSDKKALEYGDIWKRQSAEGRFKRLEASWAEHTAYIEKASGIVTPILENELRSLAGAVRQDGDRIVVFNPLPWKRSGFAYFTNAVSNAAASPAIVPFMARDIPPMGYRTFALKDIGKAKTALAKPDSLSSTFFEIKLDPARGAIASIQDRRSGRELVDSSAPYGFGQFLYERFSRDDVAAYVKAYVKIDTDWAINELGKPNLPSASEVPYRALSPANAATRFEDHPDYSVAIMTARRGEGIPAVTTRVTVYRQLPYIDLEVTVHDKPADAWPEAGWICLPFKAENAQFRLGRIGSIVDPVTDIVAGANRNLFAIATGVAVFDADGRGAGLCAMDSPLVSLDTPGCWKYSRDFIPKKPVVYVNLFNNQWTTNFRLWNEGTLTSRVRIWSVERFDAQSDLITPSLEARTPLLAADATGQGGKLPATGSGLALSRRGVQVTAFGPNPDGPGSLLRLWELSGASGPCRVQLPVGMTVTRAQPIDLRGRPDGEAIAVRQGGFEAPLKAFAPLSLRLEP